MREIKFRVWDTANNRMIDQPFLFSPKMDYHSLGDYKGDYVYNDTFGDCEDGTERPCFLMQYTGEKDKNDTEIYEGDIVARRWNDGEIRNIFSIKWDNEKIGWNISKQLLEAKCEAPSGNYCKGFEVVGNIYENPEIMEKYERNKI